MIVPVILIIVSVIYIACCYVFGEGLLTVNSVYSIPLLSVLGIYGSYELVRDIKETFKDTNPKDKNSEVKSKNRKEEIINKARKQAALELKKKQEKEAFEKNISFYENSEATKKIVTYIESKEKNNTEYAILDMALDDFFAFRDKFPDRVISLFINQANIDSSFLNIRISFCVDGQLSFYNSEESKKLQESFSLFDADNHFFTYEFIYCTGEKDKSYKSSDAFIKSYVKQYMAIRSGISFSMNKTGAYIKYL